MSKCICSIRPIRSQIADFKKTRIWSSFDERIDEKEITNFKKTQKWSSFDEVDEKEITENK
jgi:hypothetical protein